MVRLKTEHRTGRSTHAYFSHCAPCGTVVSHFPFRPRRSFNLTSTLSAGLIAGGREGRETRHTVFFTPLDPRCTAEEEEDCHDLTKPRKVH